STFSLTLHDALPISSMTRSGRELAIAHGAQFMPQSLLADRHLELVPQPLDEIYDPPAHHAMNCGNGASFDGVRQRAPVGVVEDRVGARGLSRSQTIGTVCIEAQYPVPHDLQRHPAGLGCCAAAATVQD